MNSEWKFNIMSKNNRMKFIYRIFKRDFILVGSLFYVWGSYASTNNSHINNFKTRYI